MDYKYVIFINITKILHIEHLKTIYVYQKVFKYRNMQKYKTLYFGSIIQTWSLPSDFLDCLEKTCKSI